MRIKGMEEDQDRQAGKGDKYKDRKRQEEKK